MLGRLIQTAASYGKNSAALESATEEAHTRNLLYGQSHHVYTLAQSPPGSPFAGQSFRPGSLDDRGGLELEEKDLRILIAQDAFGAEEKPTLLFDSIMTATHSPHSTSHVRHASTTYVGQRSPLPNDWRPETPFSPTSAVMDSNLPFRNRSSTISGAPSAWTRPTRDAGTREEAFLECMFGVTSSTKTTSTTKMHIMPAMSSSLVHVSGYPSSIPDGSELQNRRAPLVRARTANLTTRSPLPSVTGLDVESTSSDAVLITRLFSVTLPESIANTAHVQSGMPSAPPVEAGDIQPSSPLSPGGLPNQPKKAKLVERKVPAFAIGLVLYLPRASDTRASCTRPNSRSAHAHTLSSASSSYGSDMQNSWTFLNAIPESLASSRSLTDEADRRVEMIVSNWDVILRAFSALESQATKIIHEQLERIVNQVIGPAPKTPKEKSMQRINQRIIAITDPSVIARQKPLQRAAKHMISRICYALRVPRVITGLGFAAGHWSDEARTLHRMCGTRQHNFFFFNLLTAFLGNHTCWLQRLAPEWYRKQYRNSHRKRAELQVITQRTVIISDHRSVARRLIFILASFLPSSSGSDGLYKASEDLPSTGYLSASSPSSHLARNESLRRTANRRMRDHRLQSNVIERAVLSTSASSAESVGPLTSRDKQSRSLTRKNSDGLSMRSSIVLPITGSDGHVRKTSAGTTSTITPNPATPVAYFAFKRDSYFPDGAIAEVNESVASVDLANVLRRSSSGGTSSHVSSRWGSLMSGISEMWSAKEAPLGGPSSISTHYTTTGNASSRDAAAFSPTKSVKSVGSTQKTARDNDRGQQVTMLTSSTSRRNLKSTSPNGPVNFGRPAVAMPQMKVDDQDGVIDVDLDLPGFLKFQPDESVTSPTKRSHRPSAASGFDGAESVRSLRSAPAASPRTAVADDANVAGYIRRYHEDFTLHAVKPYAELENDIKRSMSMEAISLEAKSSQVDACHADEWTTICSTLIADIRTFSIRRISLRRRTVVPKNAHVDGQSDPQPSVAGERLPPHHGWNGGEREFFEEEVKDFDAVLADAVEKVSNLTDALQPGAKPVRPSHSRTASMSTEVNAKASPPGTSSAESNYIHVPHDFVRQDCRQAIMGALEEVAKDVNHCLSKSQKGRDILGVQEVNDYAVKTEMKQENMLREGIKRWLLDIENSSS